MGAAPAEDEGGSAFAWAAPRTRRRCEWAGQSARARKRSWRRTASAAASALKRRRLLLEDARAVAERARGRSPAAPEGRRRDPMAAAGAPRSLQFALSGVSSADTSHILHALRSVPLELRHLNLVGSDARSRARVRAAPRVFGWHNWLLPEDGRRAARVIWKSAKQLEAMPVRPLARRLWRVTAASASPTEVLCTVSAVARVVRSSRRLYGLRDRLQVWVECLLDHGHQVCVGRKELRQFGRYRMQQMASAECHGFLVRPTLARVDNELMVGSLLQTLRAIDPRGEQASDALMDRIVDDLPRFTLRWEAAVVNDLLPPAPLLAHALSP